MKFLLLLLTRTSIKSSIVRFPLKVISSLSPLFTAPSLWHMTKFYSNYHLSQTWNIHYNSILQSWWFSLVSFKSLATHFLPSIMLPHSHTTFSWPPLTLASVVCNHCPTSSSYFLCNIKICFTVSFLDTYYHHKWNIFWWKKLALFKSLWLILDLVSIVLPLFFVLPFLISLLLFFLLHVQVFLWPHDHSTVATVWLFLFKLYFSPTSLNVWYYLSYILSKTSPSVTHLLSHYLGFLTCWYQIQNKHKKLVLQRKDER